MDAKANKKISEVENQQVTSQYKGHLLTQEEKDALIKQLGAKDGKEAAKLLMDANEATFSIARQLDPQLKIPNGAKKTSFKDRSLGGKALIVLSYAATAAAAAYVGIKVKSYTDKKKEDQPQMKIKQ